MSEIQKCSNLVRGGGGQHCPKFSRFSILMPPLIEGVKNTHLNFPYHTESVSQHVDHFKQKKWNKNVRKKIIIFQEGGGYPFKENSAKIICLIFDPFP